MHITRAPSSGQQQTAVAARYSGIALLLNMRLIWRMTAASAIRRRRSRSPGRPSVQDEADVHNALLDAATKLFLKHGFERVTARQIAAAAGTTPAMIHYYFDNKLGLFKAMLDRTIQPVR